MLTLYLYILIYSTRTVICDTTNNSDTENIPYECINQFDKVCCKPECPYCGWCDSNNNNDNDTYGTFYYDCCAEMIIESKIICSTTIEPPCILVNNHMNDLERLVDLYKNGPIYLRVIVSLIFFAVGAFILYSCCIFGKKKPPLEYKYIMNLDGKFD